MVKCAAVLPVQSQKRQLGDTPALRLEVCESYQGEARPVLQFLLHRTAQVRGLVWLDWGIIWCLSLALAEHGRYCWAVGEVRAIKKVMCCMSETRAAAHTCS